MLRLALVLAALAVAACDTGTPLVDCASTDEMATVAVSPSEASPASSASLARSLRPWAPSFVGFALALSLFVAAARRSAVFA